MPGSVKPAVLYHSDYAEQYTSLLCYVKHAVLHPDGCAVSGRLFCVMPGVVKPAVLCHSDYAEQ